VDTLRRYVERAARVHNGPDEDPGSFGPALANRFEPLLGRPMDTIEEALSVARDFIQIISHCLSEPERILREVMTWRRDRR
jgi:hypothetical protein